MILWFDAQLSPAIPRWVRATFAVEAVAVRDLGLRDASDEAIFVAARVANAVVVTKDRDFVTLVGRLGTPPQVLVLSCGNTSNQRLREIFQTHLPAALSAFREGESWVEIHDKRLA